MSATEVDAGQGSQNGYVYVLGVKDINLPVCKIGRTSKNPIARCAEINRSSTGDFLWQVEYQIAVSDCHKLESQVHAKLLPLRQKGREFFGIRPEDAAVAIEDILKMVPEVTLITHAEEPLEGAGTKPGTKASHKKPDAGPRDLIYAHLLHGFTELLNVHGKPFGQTNKPYFGISDGREGVQWNLHVFTKEDKARLGVNLEGLKYHGWPIAALIQAELNAPQLPQLVPQLKDPESMTLRFSRDAWQAAARLSIVEEHLGGREYRLSEITAELWRTILTEALGCLDKERNYLGRALQEVTLKSAGPQADKRTVPVSPHLTIWTAVDPSSGSLEELSSAIERLKPVHQWASNLERTA